MKKHRGFPLFAAVALLLAGGCTLFQEEKKLPSEDIEIFKMLPYLVTIAVLIITSLRKKRENQPPASLGLAYFREER